MLRPRLRFGLALLVLLLLLGHLGLETRLLGLELRLGIGLAPRGLFGFLLLLLFRLGARLFERHAAQLRDLALGERGVNSRRELLDVEIEVVRVVAVLDGAPELELDFLAAASLRAGAGGALRILRRRARDGRRRLEREVGHGADDGLVGIVFLGLAFERAPQRHREVACRLVARVRILGERLVHHRIEERRDGVVQ